MPEIHVEGPVPVLLASDTSRRRAGRPDTVSPTLIPLLRNPVPAAGQSRDLALPQQSHGCQACRSPEPIFPFTMAFQPVVDLQESRIVAHEALIRGLAGEGAGHVLAQVNADNVYKFDQACRVKAIELAARLGMQQQLNINFLPNAVYEPRACIRATLDAAARTGFDPKCLTFEIVETEMIANTPHLLNIIAEYRRQGFKIALDDFATGYSGLIRLAEVRPDIVKLDRALVKDCDKDRTRLAIVASMIALGTQLGVKVIAEGMERRGEVDALRSVGVRFMQGFYFAKPVFQGLCTEKTLFPAEV
jgi:EAL domain-containing protein (putative c-di-GMP-specific phosphodiesterase class I)